MKAALESFRKDILQLFFAVEGRQVEIKDDTDSAYTPEWASQTIASTLSRASPWLQIDSRVPRIGMGTFASLGETEVSPHLPVPIIPTEIKPLGETHLDKYPIFNLDKNGSKTPLFKA